MASSPRSIAEEFAAAWNAADPVAVAALFVEDADFVNVVGLWWTTRQQIHDNHAYGFRHMFPDTVMVLERVRVRELEADVAVVHAGGPSRRPDCVSATSRRSGSARAAAPLGKSLAAPAID